MIRHEVVSTEKVPFSYRVAGMGSRFLAWLVDVAVWLLLIGIGALVAGVLDIGRAGLGQGLMVLWVFVLTWGYFLLFEWLWQGQTPGKRLIGIRVISWDGTAVGFQAAAVRNVVRLVDAFPLFLAGGVYGLGFLVAAGNAKHRRLGDLAAGTLVVHVERGAKPIRALQEARTEADRERLGLWRQRLGQLEREQKQTILELCLRRDQLRPGERARLFQGVAQFVRERLQLEPGEYESEEKFVLQLASILGERGPGEGEGARREKPGGRRRG